MHSGLHPKNRLFNQEVSESQCELERKTDSHFMYLHTLPKKIFPSIIKHLFAGIRTVDTPLHRLETVLRRRRRIQIISMLISDTSPFREVLSELPPAELQLGKISDAPCLRTDDDIFVVGPSF